MQTYSRRGAPSTTIRTFCKFGLKRRRVATIEWLRLLPNAGPLLQLKHTLAIALRSVAVSWQVPSHAAAPGADAAHGAERWRHRRCCPDHADGRSLAARQVAEFRYHSGRPPADHRGRCRSRRRCPTSRADLAGERHPSGLASRQESPPRRREKDRLSVRRLSGRSLPESLATRAALCQCGNY